MAGAENYATLVALPGRSLTKFDPTPGDSSQPAAIFQPRNPLLPSPINKFLFIFQPPEWQPDGNGILRFRVQKCAPKMVKNELELDWPAQNLIFSLGIFLNFRFLAPGSTSGRPSSSPWTLGGGVSQEPVPSLFPDTPGRVIVKKSACMCECVQV